MGWASLCVTGQGIFKTQRTERESRALERPLVTQNNNGFNPHHPQPESGVLLSWPLGDTEVTPMEAPPFPRTWLLRVSVSPCQLRGRGLAEDLHLRENKALAEHHPGGRPCPGLRTPVPRSCPHTLTARLRLARPRPDSHPAFLTLEGQEGSCSANLPGECACRLAERAPPSPTPPCCLASHARCRSLLSYSVNIPKMRRKRCRPKDRKNFSFTSRSLPPAHLLTGVEKQL